jgi:hypothetical protein
LKPTDLILRSRAKHGVSKDGRRHNLACGRPSRRAQERAPQDEVIDDINMNRSSETNDQVSSRTLSPPMIVLRQQASQHGFGAIFELPSRPLRNYHFIYWSSLTTV